MRYSAVVSLFSARRQAAAVVKFGVGVKWGKPLSPRMEPWYPFDSDPLASRPFGL